MDLAVKVDLQEDPEQAVMALQVGQLALVLGLEQGAMAGI